MDNSVTSEYCLIINALSGHWYPILKFVQFRIIIGQYRVISRLRDELYLTLRLDSKDAFKVIFL